MASYRAQPSRADRAKAIIAVAGMHLAVGALILAGQPPLPQIGERVRTVLIDIAPPPPPPPPAPEVGRAREEQGAAGKKADPTPVVAPQPRIFVPAKPPVAAAPVAGTGSSSNAGASTSGSGPGAGGAGIGGGGSGGVRIATEARLLSGNLGRSDYRRLRSFGASSGRALLALGIGADGRVRSCAVTGSSGDAGLDAALCAILQPRMRWSPALDQYGRPTPVGVGWVATWDRG